MPLNNYQYMQDRLNLIRDRTKSKYEQEKTEILNISENIKNYMPAPSAALQQTYQFVQENGVEKVVQNIEAKMNMELSNIDGAIESIAAFMSRNDMAFPASQEVGDTYLFGANNRNTYTRRATQTDYTLKELHRLILNDLIKTSHTGQELLKHTQKIDTLTLPNLIYQNTAYTDSAQNTDLLTEVIRRIANPSSKNNVTVWDTETLGGGIVWQYGYYDAANQTSKSRVIAPSIEYLRLLQKNNQFVQGIGLSQQDAITWNTIARMGHKDTIFDAATESVQLAGRDVPLTSGDFSRGMERFIQLAQQQNSNIVFYTNSNGEKRSITKAGKDFIDTLSETIFGKNTIAVGHNTFAFDNSVVQTMISSNPDMREYARTIGFSMPSAASGRQLDILNTIRALSDEQRNKFLQSLYGSANSILQSYSPFSQDALTHLLIPDIADISAAHDAGIDATNLFRMINAVVPGANGQSFLDVLSEYSSQTATLPNTTIRFSPEDGTQLFSIRSGRGNGLFMFTSDDLTNEITFNNGLVLNKQTGEIIQTTNNTGSASIGQGRMYRAVSLTAFDPTQISDNSQIQSMLQQMMTYQNGELSKTSDTLYIAKLQSSFPDNAQGTRTAAASTYIIGTQDDISRMLGSTMVPMSGKENDIKTSLGTILSTPEGKQWVQSKFGIMSDNQLEQFIENHSDQLVQGLQEDGSQRLLYDRALRSSRNGSYYTVSMVGNISDISDEIVYQIQQHGGQATKSDVLRYMMPRAVSISQQIVSHALPAADSVVQGVSPEIIAIMDTGVNRIAEAFTLRSSDTTNFMDAMTQAQNHILRALRNGQVPISEDQVQTMLDPKLGYGNFINKVTGILDTIESIDNPNLTTESVGQTKALILKAVRELQKEINAVALNPGSAENVAYMVSEFGEGFVQYTKDIKNIVDTVMSGVQTSTATQRNQIQKIVTEQAQKLYWKSMQEKAGDSTMNPFRIPIREEAFRIRTPGFISAVKEPIEYLDISLDQSGAYSFIHKISSIRFPGQQKISPVRQTDAILNFIDETKDPALYEIQQWLRGEEGRKFLQDVSPLQLTQRVQQFLRKYRETHPDDMHRPDRQIINVPQLFSKENVRAYGDQIRKELQPALQQFASNIHVVSDKSVLDDIMDVLYEDRDTIKKQIQSTFWDVASDGQRQVSEYGKFVLQLYDRQIEETKKLFSQLTARFGEGLHMDINKQTGRVLLGDGTHTIDVTSYLPKAGFHNGTVVTTLGSQDIITMSYVGPQYYSSYSDTYGPVRARTSIGHALAQTFSLKQRAEYRPEQTELERAMSFLQDFARNMRSNATYNIELTAQDARRNALMDYKGVTHIIPRLLAFRFNELQQELGTEEALALQRVYFGEDINGQPKRLDPESEAFRKLEEHVRRHGAAGDEERLAVVNKNLSGIIRVALDDYVPGFDPYTDAMLNTVATGKATQLQEYRVPVVNSNIGMTTAEKLARDAENSAARAFVFDADETTQLLQELGFGREEFTVGNATFTGFGNEMLGDHIVNGKRYAADIDTKIFIGTLEDIEERLDNTSDETLIKEFLPEDAMPSEFKWNELRGKVLANTGTVENAAAVDARIIDAINRQQNFQQMRQMDQIQLLYGQEDDQELLRRIMREQKTVFPIITVSQDGTVSVQYTGGRYVQANDTIFTKAGYSGTTTTVRAKQEGLVRTAFFDETGLRVSEQTIADYLNQSGQQFKNAQDVWQYLLSQNKYRAAVYNQALEAEAVVKMATDFSEKHETVGLFAGLGTIDTRIEKTLRGLGLSRLIGRTVSYDIFQDLQNLKYNELFGHYINQYIQEGHVPELSGFKIRNQDDFDHWVQTSIRGSFKGDTIEDTRANWSRAVQKERYMPSELLTRITGGAHYVASSYAEKHGSVTQIASEIIQSITHDRYKSFLRQGQSANDALSAANQYLVDRYGRLLGGLQYVVREDTGIGRAILPSNPTDIQIKDFLSVLAGDENLSRETKQRIDNIISNNGPYTTYGTITQIHGAYTARYSGAFDNADRTSNKGVAISDRELSKFTIARYDDTFIKEAKKLYDSDEAFQKIYGDILDWDGNLSDEYRHRSIVQPFIDMLQKDFRLNSPFEQSLAYSAAKHPERYKNLPFEKQIEEQIRYKTLADLQRDGQYDMLSVDEKRTAEYLIRQNGSGSASRINLQAVRDNMFAASAWDASEFNAKSEIQRAAVLDKMREYGFSERNASELFSVSNANYAQSVDTALGRHGYIANFTDESLGLNKRFFAQQGISSTLAIPMFSEKQDGSRMIQNSIQTAFTKYQRAAEDLSSQIKQDNNQVLQTDRQQKLRQRVADAMRDIQSAVAAEGSGKASELAERGKIRMAYSARPSVIVGTEGIYNPSPRTGKPVIGQNARYRGKLISEFYQQGTYRPDVAFVGRDTLEKMGLITPNMSEDMINARLKRLSTEGINVFLNRAPSDYPGSVLAARMYFDRNLVSGQIKLSEALAAKQKADSDGDQIAIIASQYADNKGKIYNDLMIEELIQQSRLADTEQNAPIREQAIAALRELEDNGTMDKYRQMSSMIQRAQDYETTVRNPIFRNIKNIEASIEEAAAKRFGDVDTWINLQSNRVIQSISPYISMTPGTVHMLEVNQINGKRMQEAQAEFDRVRRLFNRDIQGLNVDETGKEDLFRSQFYKNLRQGDDAATLREQFVRYVDDNIKNGVMQESTREKLQTYFDAMQQEELSISKNRRLYAGYANRPLFLLSRLNEMAQHDRYDKNTHLSAGLTAIGESFLSPKNATALDLRSTKQLMNIFQAMWENKNDQWQTDLKEYMDLFVEKYQGNVDKEQVKRDTVEGLKRLMRDTTSRKDLLAFDRMFTTMYGSSRLDELTESRLALQRHDEFDMLISGKNIREMLGNTAHGSDTDSKIVRELFTPYREQSAPQETVPELDEVTERAIRRIPDRLGQQAIQTFGNKRMAAALMLGLTFAGYVGGNPSVSPQQRGQVQQAQAPVQTRQMPQFSDTSLNALRNGPQNAGYIININAQSPQGQQAAQDALSTAMNRSLRTDVNISMNVMQDRTISQDDIDNYLQSQFA